MVLSWKLPQLQGEYTFKSPHKSCFIVETVLLSFNRTKRVVYQDFAKYLDRNVREASSSRLGSLSYRPQMLLITDNLSFGLGGSHCSGKLTDSTPFFIC